MNKRGKREKDKSKDKRYRIGKELKRGVSQIIVTIILVAIMLIAIGIVWAVISNIISKQSKEISLEKLTVDAEIKGISINESANNISVLVRRKPGHGNLIGFNFVFNNGTDNELHTLYTDTDTPMNELEERIFTFHLSMNVSNVLTISLIPLIKSGGKEIFGSMIEIYDLRARRKIEVPPPAECTSTTCSILGYECGTWANGTCPGILNCGTCGTGYSCVEGNCVPTTTPGYECSSCSDCNNAIANANPGDIIYLNTSLNNIIGTCINFAGKDNVIFDCRGNYIIGDNLDTDYGIYLENIGDGSKNNVIRNCKIRYFAFGIWIHTGFNITLENITINNNTQYGMTIASSSNSTLKNIEANFNFLNGMYLSSIINSILTDITASSNFQWGILLTVYSNNNTLTNVKTNSNSNIGLYVVNSNQNNITNLTSNSNQEGVRLDRDSNYNKISKSHIEKNTIYGLYLRDSGGFLPQYNLIYDNYFNNTNNHERSTSLINYFNTTKTLGTNIVNGIYIGGNYWANPSGIGFSETCADLDIDGICDSPYNIENSGDYDYLPLS